MSLPSAPPPVVAPEPPPVQETQFAPPPKPASPLRRIWTGFVALVAAIWKFALPILKLAKGLKILLTAGSMLVSVWLYASFFGWQFAVGFVLCLFVHEMGHVFAAWRLKVPVSAPIFIPMMGAVILSKRGGKSVWDSALIGYGGPLFGTLAAVVCWWIYSVTGNPLFLGLAYTAFFLNLFNMTPIFPLDGGWITGVISPYIWVVGIAVMAVMVFSGFVRNPLIFIVLILSLPSLVRAFKTGKMQEGPSATPNQRLGMGLAYVGLCGFLFWGMGRTNDLNPLSPRHQQYERDQPSGNGDDSGQVALARPARTAMNRPS